MTDTVKLSILEAVRIATTPDGVSLELLIGGMPAVKRQLTLDQAQAIAFGLTRQVERASKGGAA